MVCRKRLTFAYFYIIFLKNIVSCTQCQQLQVEDHTVFYTQTFYRLFGHAEVAPHFLQVNYPCGCCKILSSFARPRLVLACGHLHISHYPG